MQTFPRAPALVSALLAVTLLEACGGENTASKVQPPGGEPANETRTLEAGASLLQDKTPLKKLNAYLDGFHFASGNLAQQMEAHHYCGHVTEEMIQCTLFDGNGEDAKLIGIEYIISAKLFAGLPTDEKHLWHSHVHEVQSGQLIAPGIPEVAEQELMQQIAGTYGKTWHTWHTEDKQALPLGAPMLMMGFTRDGQLDEARVRERDQRFDVSSGRKRDDRRDLNYPIVDTDADAWQKGIAMQVEARPVPPQATKP
jgi:hypothetical protein